jgi:hypothetical protein
MKSFILRSQKGKDVMSFIKSIENKDLTNRERLDLISNFSDSWEENQLPEGIEITTNSFGLPEITLNN